MCWCTPAIRTPWCGKPGCEGPERPDTTTPEPYNKNRWLAEMGYATWRMIIIRTHEVPESIPETLKDSRPEVQQAWLAAAAAIRRRVVNWSLSAEEPPPCQ